MESKQSLSIPRIKSTGELTEEHYNAMGSSNEGVLVVTTAFYKKVFDDPLLGCMFIDKGEHHAQRLMWLLLYFMQVSSVYFEKRSGFPTIHAAHYRCQHLNSRADAPPGAGRPGGPFTFSQRDTWKKYFLEACSEASGMGDSLLQDMSAWVDFAMNFYAPFENDRIE